MQGVTIKGDNRLPPRLLLDEKIRLVEGGSIYTVIGVHAGLAMVQRRQRIEEQERQQKGIVSCRLTEFVRGEISAHSFVYRVSDSEWVEETKEKETDGWVIQEEE